MWATMTFWPSFLILVPRAFGFHRQSKMTATRVPPSLIAWRPWPDEGDLFSQGSSNEIRKLVHGWTSTVQCGESTRGAPASSFARPFDSFAAFTQRNTVSSESLPSVKPLLKLLTSSNSPLCISFFCSCTILGFRSLRLKITRMRILKWNSFAPFSQGCIAELKIFVNDHLIILGVVAVSTSGIQVCIFALPRRE